MEQDNIKEKVGTLLSDTATKKEAQMYTRELLTLASSALIKTDNPKVAKVIALGSAAWTVYEASRGLYRLYKRSTPPSNYTIKISEDDAIYEVVEDWLMDAMNEETQYYVTAHSAIKKGDTIGKKRGRNRQLASRSSMDDIFSGHSDSDRMVVDYSFDGSAIQEVTIRGHKVTLFTTSPERKSNLQSFGADNNLNGKGYRSRTMTIVVPSLKARKDVLKEIEEQSQHLVKSQPRMYLSDRWGGTRKKAEIQPRSRNSVILKEGQMDRIVDHLQTFINNKDAYEKADIPFRTGILLYGEPGSGKSSTALAIANELKMNVYIIALSALMNDEALNDCFTSIPANSIIILEDIDIASAVRERDPDDEDDEKGVTMSGMLNVLDGFQSPPGVITIMTTNRKDVLDPAIIRPGRIDLQEHLGCLDTYQLRGMCEYFMKTVPEGLPHITPEDGISSAAIMGVMRKHLPDFQNAADDVVEFILDVKGKNLEKALTTEES